MSISNLGSLALSIAIASAMVGFISNSSNANRPVISETELMTQNSNNSPKKENEVRLPDNVLKQVEEIERRSQQKQADDFAREMSKKTPKEREEMEKERKRLKEIEFAPKTKTEEELRREDERAIKVFNELKAKRKKE